MMALSLYCFFKQIFFSIILLHCYPEQVLCQNLVQCLYGRRLVWQGCAVPDFRAGVRHSSTRSTMYSEIRVGVINFILM